MIFDLANITRQFHFTSDAASKIFKRNFRAAVTEGYMVAVELL